MSVVRILAVGGLDPSGGAGLLADVDAIREAGGRGLAACAALTAQGDAGVRGVFGVPPDFLEQQVLAVGTVDAVKTGMLGGAAVVELLCGLVDAGSLPAPVVDPVILASSGATLLDGEGVRLMGEELVPRALAVTPNLSEAAILTGRAVRGIAQMEDAARALVDAGARLAVISGGHLEGDPVEVGLARTDDAPWRVVHPRVPGTARGTGCRFASFLVTRLALGDTPRMAVAAAGGYVAGHVGREAQ